MIASLNARNAVECELIDEALGRVLDHIAGRGWGEDLDVVFTTGQYTQVSMMLNSFGVQLDPGQTLDPDLKGF